MGPRWRMALRTERPKDVTSSGAPARANERVRWALVLARVDGTLARSTPGADHCHQMLLLSLLRRSLRQQEEERK